MGEPVHHLCAAQTMHLCDRTGRDHRSIRTGNVVPCRKWSCDRRSQQGVCVCDSKCKHRTHAWVEWLRDMRRGSLRYGFWLSIAQIKRRNNKKRQTPHGWSSSSDAWMSYSNKSTGWCIMVDGWYIVDTFGEFGLKIINSQYLCRLKIQKNMLKTDA